MSVLSIKVAGIDDINSVAVLFDLYRQFYEQAPSLELAMSFIKQRIYNQESVILLAEEYGEPVGFCQLYPSFCSVIAAPIYVLYDLFVHPAKRRTGAGKALLLAAEQQAEFAGVARMDLTTARTNTSAQALYESLGWKNDTVFIAYNKNIVTS